MKFLLCLTLICLPDVCWAQVTKVASPVEISVEFDESVPEEIQGLQWNRWTSKNFTVLSLDDTQAQYLHNHLELIKVWILTRWGFPDVDFSAECKVICVDDPVLFEKLFKLKSSRVEVRRDASGLIKETVIFLLANDVPSKTLPAPLTEVCLAEFARSQNTKFGLWAYRGMAQLNESLDQIRGRIRSLKTSLDTNQPLYFSQGLLEMTSVEYDKLPVDRRELYDISAQMFCLLIRKEFGQDKTHEMLQKTSGGSPETALQTVLNFRDYDEFDASFKRYMIDLTGDVTNDQTPDHYLQIIEKQD